MKSPANRTQNCMPPVLHDAPALDVGNGGEDWPSVPCGAPTKGERPLGGRYDMMGE